MEFSEFILLHDGDDLGELALSRDRYVRDVEDFDRALTTLEVRRKLRGKVPRWWGVPSLQYPSRLSGEQCSSEETARYKASVAMKASAGAVIADLTGGMGVDTWAFAQLFGRVLYNEMQAELADAALYNFRELGLENVTVCSRELVPGALAGILEGFRPDILYLDPARRAADGRKVFRLEDCRPDVLQLLPELLEACPLVLLKLSPMADISLVCKQLGCVREVHVVAAEGECKELLLLLERGYEGAYGLYVVEDGAVQEMPHPKQEDWTVGGEVSAAKWLFEPGKALLKAGVFGWPCRFGLQKLGQHTHAYLGLEPVEALKPFGKWYRILEVAPLNNRSIKEIGKKYPRAEVTARNIPLTSEQLRARLGVRSGGEVHLFGLHADMPFANLLLVCTGQ